MKFLSVFNEIEKGNYALTEEAIYASINNGDEMIPLWGGNAEHNTYDRMVSMTARTKKNVPITIFSKEGIIISLDGSAGSMTYKNGERFALNHHAGFITLKDETGIVDLEYFALFTQNFYRSLAISEGSKTLSLKQIYSEEFELPPYETQKRIMACVKPFIERLSCLKHIRQSIEADLLERAILLNLSVDSYQANDVPLSQIMDYMGGSSSLTEEKNYTRLKNEGESYQVLTGASAMDEPLVIRLNNNDKIASFEDKDGLLIIRKGKAGYTRFLAPGKYVINDDAYIFYVKDNCPFQINLRWFAYQYKTEILSYASSSDNGTWNMTGFYMNTHIDIPLIDAQNRLVALWEMLEKHLAKLDKLQNDFETIISKEIAIG